MLVVEIRVRVHSTLRILHVLPDLEQELEKGFRQICAPSNDYITKYVTFRKQNWMLSMQV
uniref:Uncharacterized protein n=1 Tax=Setaria italica TaxID=4555 RepID=K4AHU9_SETIT